MALITTNVNEAAQALRRGNPVAIPTETVYGLAALIDNPKAIETIFAIKKRPLTHPLIVHITTDYDLMLLVHEIPDYARQLMAHFWPGPLTLLFKKRLEGINPLITGGQATIAIRAPAHPLTQQLLKQLATPVVAPSANPFGKISPTTAQHVQHAFSDPDNELIILDGGRCKVGIESTIVDVTQPDRYQILRPGMIDESAIAAVIDQSLSSQLSSIRVPGALASHYQPQKRLFYCNTLEQLTQFCRQHPQTVYVIASQKPATVSQKYYYPLAHDARTAAYDLYYQLRIADASSATVIAIELPANTTHWQGIRERIIKAGALWHNALNTD